MSTSPDYTPSGIPEVSSPFFAELSPGESPDTVGLQFRVEPEASVTGVDWPGLSRGLETVMTLPNGIRVIGHPETPADAASGWTEAVPEDRTVYRHIEDLPHEDGEPEASIRIGNRLHSNGGSYPNLIVDGEAVTLLPAHAGWIELYRRIGGKDHKGDLVVRFIDDTEMEGLYPDQYQHWQARRRGQADADWNATVAGTAAVTTTLLPADATSVEASTQPTLEVAAAHRYRRWPLVAAAGTLVLAAAGTAYLATDSFHWSPDATHAAAPGHAFDAALQAAAHTANRPVSFEGDCPATIQYEGQAIAGNESELGHATLLAGGGSFVAEHTYVAGDKQTIIKCGRLLMHGNGVRSSGHVVVRLDPAAVAIPPTT